MAINLKELSTRKDLLSGGHRACAGCACTVAIRQVLIAASDTPLVCGCATGCMEVVTTIYPFTAWRTPFIHNAFENVAATISGAESAYRALKKKGKIDKDIKFIAFGGDGGTYDIGLQALSGVAERGHNMLYICYNNEAYMNTGIQRSSATPKGAHTTTSPAGKVIPGKRDYKKDLTGIMAAHNMPFVAQASPHNFMDLMNKVQKALNIGGPTFINILASCNRGWRIPVEKSISIGKLAADTCVWPLYEVENGKWKLNYKPKEKKPVTDWIKSQGRFKHLLKPQNKELVEEIQANVDAEWQKLLERCGNSK